LEVLPVLLLERLLLLFASNLLEQELLQVLLEGRSAELLEEQLAESSVALEAMLARLSAQLVVD
jgi:hypothetical protein